MTLPDEFDDETADRLYEQATQVQDEGDLLVQETDHVPSTENVPEAVADTTDATVGKSGDGRYRISLRKE